MAALNQNPVIVNLAVSIAWWLKPYFYCLATMSDLTGMEPNWERVNYWINKAIKVKVA